MVTYGGDEVAGLVMDVGTSWTRAGYAGEDTPKCIFPTFVGYKNEEKVSTPRDVDTQMVDVAETEGEGGASESTATVQKPRKYFIGDGELNIWRPGMEVKNPLKEGQVEDWDIMEKIWDYAFHSRLRVEPSEHPLLCTEPSWNVRENQHKLAELAFEKFQFPAFYLASDAAMTAFAAGRPTALVLSSGSAITSAVPVYDGFVLKKGILRQDIAGDFISEQALAHLKRDLNFDVTPQYLVKSKRPVDAGQPPDVVLRSRPDTTESYHHFQQLRVIHEWKESVGQVAEATYDEQALSMRPQKPFEFPNGANYIFGAERWNAPEVLFSPRRYIDKPDVGGSMSVAAIEQIQGVAQLIFNSVSLCDVELRPLLLNNVVVAGGNTLWQGFNDRLNWELTSLTPGSKIKIHAPGNTAERKCSSWLGGSILASLGTFHQLWVSKKEYEEYGPSIIDKKCH